MPKIAELFFEQARLNENKQAIWCEGKVISYKELADLVSRYANFFIECGIEYGDRIGIPMVNSIESVGLLLAAANNGVAIVPINPTMPPLSTKQIFKAADVKHIMASERFLEKNPELNVEGRVICLDSRLSSNLSLLDSSSCSNSRPMIEKVTGKEAFIITATSGSTGTPKPILLTQKNKYDRIIAHIKLYNITSDDNVLAATPLYHSLAERLVLIPLVLGGTCTLVSRFTAKRWIEIVQEQQVTFTISVSAQLNQISSLMDEKFNDELSSLRCIVSSSALLEETVREKLIKLLCCDFFEMYGTSETSTVTSINFREAKEKQRSVGKPLLQAEVIILNEFSQVMEPLEIGEIACKTELMCESYYNQSDIFLKSFCEQYFKTGDLGYLDSDGYLYYVGRKKELIITGGINVYPNDVDRCVVLIPEIEECAAFSYPDESLGEVVALAVVVKEGKSLTSRDIQRFCVNKLADFQQPKKIFFVEKLPKNAMGKLTRNSIIEMVRR